MDFLREYAEKQYSDGIKENDQGRASNGGLGAFLWQQFVDEDKLKAEKQKTYNTQTALAQNVNLSDLNVGPNASTYDVKGAAISKREEKAKEASATTHTRNIEAATAPLALELQSQNLNASEDRDIRNKQFAIQQQQLRNDRADALDARAEDREYRRSQDRKDDLRYNENIERMDRKDRKQSIQTLVQGLASLGAAFAL